MRWIMSRVARYVLVPALLVMPFIATGCPGHSGHCLIKGKDVERDLQVQANHQGGGPSPATSGAGPSFVEEPATYVKRPVSQPGDTSLPY